MNPYRAIPAIVILSMFIMSSYGCQKNPPPENGEHTVYFWSGGPVRDIKNYKDGKLHGPVRIYYKNGTLKVRTQYVNGKPDGEYRKYAQDGTVIIKATFKNGEVVEKENVHVKKMLEQDMKK